MLSSYMPNFSQVSSITSTSRRFAADPPSNLGYMIPSRNLVGREEDKKKIKKSLETARMLTLVSEAGYGKTSLAVQVASELEGNYMDGIRVVELAALSDPALVPQVVAAEIGVPESPEFPLLQSLRHYLRQRNMLLVLDNCEHMIEACVKLSNHILGSTSGVQILATSREPLKTKGNKGVKHNKHVPVPALDRPRAQSEEHAASEEDLPASIQLFQARASELGSYAEHIVRESRAVVRDICNQLEGIPLAIELAAARTDQLRDPDMVPERLSTLIAEYKQRHNGLGALWATIDWTEHLLSKEDRDIFRQMSIFAGTFSLKAAEWIYGKELGYRVADSLRRLEKNYLLRCMHQGDDPRYVMHDAIRDYVRGRSTFTYRPQVRRRYLEWYVKLVAEAEDKFPSSDREAWLGRLDLEIDNIRAVLGWALENNKIKEALSIAGSMGVYWFFRNNYSEGILWLDRVLGHADATRHSRAYALALFGAGLLHRAKDDSEEARAFLERSVALRRKQVANSKDVKARKRAKWYLAFALTFSGLAERGLKDTSKAYADLEESFALFRELQFTWGQALACTYLGNVKLAEAMKLDLPGQSAVRRRKIKEAVDALDDALATFLTLEDSWGIEQTLIYLGIADYLRGGYQQSSERFKECLLRKLDKRQSHVHHTYDDKRSIARCFAELGSIAHKLDRPVRAALLLGVANAIRRDLGVGHARRDFSEYRKTTRELRDSLGQAGRMALFLAGDAMPLDQAVAYVTLDSFVSSPAAEYEGFEEHIEQFLCDVAGIPGLRAVAFSIRSYREKPCSLLVYALGDFDHLRESGTGLKSESYKTHSAITEAYDTLHESIEGDMPEVACSLWFVDTSGDDILDVLRDIKEKLVDDVSDILPELQAMLTPEELLFESQSTEEMFAIALSR